MQFGIKVPGTPCGTFPPTHEIAPWVLYKHVILATYSLRNLALKWCKLSQMVTIE